MKPFSKNIIFFDTEFSSLDPYVGEILSVGMVKYSGEELYFELEHDGECSEWVKENLLHTLKGPKISREDARQKITDFVGDSTPYIVSYVNSFDALYLYKLLGLEESNKIIFWIPIDFASILFGLGIDPEIYQNDEMKYVRDLGIDLDRYTIHNALDDAKILREVYLKLENN